VVKMAPELPIDQFFPYIHLERSFMHLGFQIYDVAFQSRNSEAAKPIVFTTTLLLIGLVFAMNAASIMIRNRLKRKFHAGLF
jgi:phosphate transport system permease protein